MQFLIGMLPLVMGAFVSDQNKDYVAYALIAGLAAMGASQAEFRSMI